MSVPVAPEEQTDLDPETEERAVWSGASINDLPDSAFAYIEPGGSKDSEGKTTPRDKRHLPYKNAAGAVDKAHVKNALARLPKTQISDAAKASARRKLVAAAKSVGVQVSEETETRAAPTTTETARLWIPIRSTNAETREIEGVLSDEQVDMHGTIFAYDGMKEAVNRWAGNIREQHDPKKAVGRKVLALFDDDKREITLRARISKGAQDTWEKILDGTLGGFSVGVWNVRKTGKRTVNNKVVPVFEDFDLFEASVVDVPSNLGAQASGLTIYRAAAENGEDEYNQDFDDYPLPDEPVATPDAGAAGADAAADESRAAPEPAVEPPASTVEPTPAPAPMEPKKREILKGAQTRVDGGGELAFTNVPLSPLSPDEVAGLEAEGAPDAERAMNADTLSSMDAVDKSMESDRGPHEHGHAHSDDYSPLHLHGHTHTHEDGTEHDHRHMHNHGHHDHYGDEQHAHAHKHFHDHSHTFRNAAPDTSTWTCPQPGEEPAGAETRGFVEPAGTVEFNAAPGQPGADAEFDAMDPSSVGCGCCDACTGPDCGCCDECLGGPMRANAKLGTKGDGDGDADDKPGAKKGADDDNDEEDESDTTPGGKNASRAESRAGKRLSDASMSKIHRSIQDLLELCNCDDCQDALSALNRGDDETDEATRVLTRAVTRELAPLHATISQLRAVAARLTAVQGADWSHVQQQLGELRSSQEEALRLVHLIAEQEQPGAPMTRMADAKLTPVDKRLVINPDATLDASQAPARDLASELEQIRAAGGFKNLEEQLSFATRLTQQAPILKR